MRCGGGFHGPEGGAVCCFSVSYLLDAWLRWAMRSRLAPFVKLARTIRARRANIANALAFKLIPDPLVGDRVWSEAQPPRPGRRPTGPGVASPQVSTT